MLVDAGPLVALLSKDDARYRRCRAVFRGLREPPLTVWPVLTDAMHLLRDSWGGQDRLFGLLEVGSVEIAPLGPGDLSRMRQLMQKYHDLPMDFADAALVTVAEREGITRVFTLDRRDFEVYRPAKIGRFSLVP
ncbi:MAG TPA: PIN domain-containing protein [Methylomirabilota bacterium]|nr:PIN domain-containing protein [Methylomirabilota bacterium]